MRLSTLVMWVIVAAGFALSMHFFSELPDKMVAHWGLDMQPDGFMDKFWGVLVLPLIMTVLALLFQAIPEIDPLRENIDVFRGNYERFVVILTLFLFSLHAVMLLWNLGQEIDFMLFLAIWFAVLFFSAGELCKKSRRNWFIGVRTPWNMNSDVVWGKTNRLAGVLFKVCALIVLAGLLFPGWFFAFIVLPMIAFGLIVVWYSYYEYKKEWQRPIRQ